LTTTWLDSARVARRAWKQFANRGYGLANISGEIGYRFKHHDALEDAKAAGHVLIAAIKETGLDLEQWLTRVTEPINSTGNAGGKISRTGSPDGNLQGEVVVFTGNLELTRLEAAELAAKAGCDVASTVTRKTTMLVVGDQDVARLAGHSKSSKHRKAEQLMSMGTSIRILRETDFKAIIAKDLAN
jgi:DNA polymerase-3 subunit epsilon